MLKLLLLALVVGVVFWMLSARRRPPGPRKPPAASKSAANPATNPATKAEPAPMLACAHCGLHLPQAEAVFDAGGQVFCSDAHRLAGPR